MGKLTEQLSAIIDDIDLDDGDVSASTFVEMDTYKLPRGRKDLAPKTPKNYKLRVTNLKKAESYVEKAVAALAKIPPLDYMGDVVRFSEDLMDWLEGDAGEGGMKALVKIYERELGKK